MSRIGVGRVWSSVWSETQRDSEIAREREVCCECYVQGVSGMKHVLIYERAVFS